MDKGDIKVENVLVSVSNAEGLEAIVGAVIAGGANVFATSGTAKRIESFGYQCRTLENLTGFAQMLDGRVKTLHPKVFAPILANMSKREHRTDLESMGVPKFDMLVVNLYPFEDKAKELARGETTEELDELIEHIDIGGVALIRAGAKNFAHTAVATSPAQYEEVIKELKTRGMALSYATRLKLAVEAFHHTAWYDTLICSVMGSYDDMGGGRMHGHMVLPLEHHASVRYGENPDMGGAVYTPPLAIPTIARAYRDWEMGMVGMNIRQGKPMSFNNYMDTYWAWAMVWSFDDPACAFVKHNNPCGLAIGDSAMEAFEKAYDSDPMSAFGGIIALNRTFTEDMAKALKGKFFEVIIAPSYEDGALETLAKKKNLRVLEAPQKAQNYRPLNPYSMDIKKAGPYFLVQEGMTMPKEPVNVWPEVKVVSEREPTEGEWQDLDFAFRAVGFVKSNAIVLAKNRATVGIGAGQMSRVDAMDIAVRKAGDRSRGSVVGSDAFFPFRDSIDLAAEHGITAVIEPGGSIRDEEVIKAANEHDIALVFTSKRVFRH